MQTKTIGVRQLYRELKKITEATKRGQSFTVLKNTEPIFRIEPVTKTQKKSYNFADLDNLAKEIQEEFKKNKVSKNLSQEIDSIVYGI
jgi:antitoxin (DNA-binding transcriptional repressor) of toxin-antitoxin stability system